MLGLEGPTEEWPRCPVCDSLLQPIESWASTGTEDEQLWYCTGTLCDYSEFRTSR